MSLPAASEVKYANGANILISLLYDQAGPVKIGMDIFNSILIWQGYIQNAMKYPYASS